jgi:hypothetical protein
MSKIEPTKLTTSNNQINKDINKDRIAELVANKIRKRPILFR